MVPAIIYGGEAEPQKLTLSGNDILKRRSPRRLFEILDVSDGQIQPAVIRDLQRNPTNGAFSILIFNASVDKEIGVNVPLHFINEAACVGVKMSGHSHP